MTTMLASLVVGSFMVFQNVATIERLAHRRRHYKYPFNYVMQFDRKPSGCKKNPDLKYDGLPEMLNSF